MNRSSSSNFRRTGWAVVVLVGALGMAGCGTRLGQSTIAADAGSVAIGPASDTGGSGTTSSGDSGSGSSGSSVTGSTGGGTGSTGATTGGGSTGSTGGSSGGSTGGSTGSTGGSTGGSTSSGGSTGSSTSGSSGSTATGAVSTGVNPIFGGNGTCAAATGSPVNIGNVSTLSGVLGLLFQPVVPALNTFVKAQNNCGGLNGHPIHLYVEDDQDDPSTAASDAQDEIENDHILAFVGNIQVLTINAMTSIVNSTHVPIIGGDITNNTWFSSSYIFPEGPPPEAISVGFLQAMTKTYHDTAVGDVYCLEVPQACEQIDKGFNDLASDFGATVKSSIQISITSPSYTSQCLTAQSDKITAMALIVDAPTQNRYANSCAKVGYRPQYIAYPLGVGNQSEFFGNPNLGNTYVPLNTFPWMADTTPAEQYYQKSVAQYDPGFTTGDAASLGWTSGALLVAASSGLSASNPTSAQLVEKLYTFKGQSFTTLGGLTAPLTFNEGGLPSAPYCLFAAVSNASDSAWASSISTPDCSTLTAPGAPK